jgi:hypothetical protein
VDQNSYAEMMPPVQKLNLRQKSSDEIGSRKKRLPFGFMVQDGLHRPLQLTAHRLPSKTRPESAMTTPHEERIRTLQMELME